MEDTIIVEHVLRRLRMPFDDKITGFIGSGAYRDVSRIGDFVVKKLKPSRTKKYGPFSIKYKMNPYTQYKFGIEDFNKEEIENYNCLLTRVPNDMKKYFAKIFWAGNYDGKSSSISELIKDWDNSPSKSLKEFGEVKSKSFWEVMGKLEDLLINRDIPLLDIRDSNILVKFSKDVEPILFDYKRYGSKTYPFQPLLFFKSARDRKIHGRFNRLREKYEVKR